MARLSSPLTAPFPVAHPFLPRTKTRTTSPPPKKQLKTSDNNRRHREFKANQRREFARLAQSLQAYALVARGVRLLATNQTGSRPRATVVMTQGSPDTWDGIVTVFGPRTAAGLQPLHADLTPALMAAGRRGSAATQDDDGEGEEGPCPASASAQQTTSQGDETGPCITGFVSKPGAGGRAHGAVRALA